MECLLVCLWMLRLFSSAWNVCWSACGCRGDSVVHGMFAGLPVDVEVVQ